MRQLIATLRRGPAPLLGTFVALVMATAVVTWGMSLGMSCAGAKPQVNQLAGTSVVITSATTAKITTGHGENAETTSYPLTSYRPVPAAVAGRIRQLPGVASVIADHSAPVGLSLPSRGGPPTGRVITGSGGLPLTAHGWASAALTPFTLQAGHAPRAADQIVVGATLAARDGLRLADSVRLTGQSSGPLQVVGIAAAPAGNDAAARTVFLTDARAATLAGAPGTATLIGVLATPGTGTAELAARIRAAVASVHVAGRALAVHTGKDRGVAEDPLGNSKLFGMSALWISAGSDMVAIALFVVAGTVGLAVSSRARAIALLRAVGATPGQIRRMIMIELAALGLVAGAIGYLPGIAMASYSLRGLAAHQVIPHGLHTWTSWWLAAGAGGIGLVLAEIAGCFVARRASRARPATALREAGLERRTPRLVRLVLGVIALAGGVTLGVLVWHETNPVDQFNQALLVLLLFMVSAAFLGPYLMSLAEFVLRVPLRLLGGTSGRLASAELRARPRRMASAVVAIGLAVAFAGTIALVNAAVAHTGRAQASERIAAAAVISAPGPGASPALLGQVAARPQVAQAVGLIPTTVYLSLQGGTNASAEGITPGRPDALLHLKITHGSLAALNPGEIALSSLLAGGGTRVGDVIHTYLADGTPYRARVVAIYARSFGFGDALVPADVAGGGHLGASGVSSVLVGAKPGANMPALAADLAALTRRYPGLAVADRTVANKQAQDADSQNSYVNTMLLGVMGCIVAISLVNTLVVATLQGSGEITLLRWVGTSGRQLLAATAWRALVITGVGLLVGAATASAALVAVSKAMTGSSLPYLAPAPMAVIVGLVGALTALGIFVPTLRMLRRGTEAAAG